MAADLQKRDTANVGDSFPLQPTSSSSMPAYSTGGLAPPRQDRKLRQWLILANVAAWIAIIAAVGYFVF